MLEKLFGGTCLGTHTAKMIPEHDWMWQWADVFYHFKKDIIKIFKLLSVIKVYCCHCRGYLLCKKTTIM